MDRASKQILLIGIDFGTTFTGISWSTALNLTQSNFIQTRKVVEDLDWGSHHDHSGLKIHQGLEQYKGTKLRLGQVVPPAQLDDTHLRGPYRSGFEEISVSMTIQDVVGGYYFREICKYTMQELQLKPGANNMRTIMTESDVTATGSLKLVLPGEPAAWKCHEHVSARQKSYPSHKPNFVDTSDCLIVCDSGGGTTDINILREHSESQLSCHHQRHHQRGYYISRDAHKPKIMKVSDPFIGDQGIGPNFGKPNMGREDDDDDNCVGFRGFSGLAQRSNAPLDGVGRHGRAREKIHLLGAGQCGTIPRVGPPKRDPVAVAIGGHHVERCADEMTLRVWRDAITRTCGEGGTGCGGGGTGCGRGTDCGAIKAKEWKEPGYNSGRVGIHCSPRGGGGHLRAH